MRSRIDRRRWITTAVVSLVGGLGFGAYGAIAAPAKAPKSTVSDYSVLVGPFAASDGFKAEIQAVGCGTKHGGVLVIYLKGNERVALEHSYAGSYSSCTVSKTLEASHLKIRWGNVLKVDATISAKTKLKKDHVPGCTGTYYEYRSGKLKGSASLAIHPKIFGKQNVATAPIKDFAYVSAECPPANGSSAATVPLSGTATTSGFATTARHSALAEAPSVANARVQARFLELNHAAAIAAPATTVATATTTGASTAPTTTSTTTTTTTTTTAPPTVTPDGSGTQFFAIFDDENLVISSATDAPADPLTIINDYANDEPATNVFGTMAVMVQTPQAFTVGPGDGSARLVAAAAFAKGTIDFSATFVCNGTSDALDGRLTGRIIVSDPIFGKIAYNGPKALGAAVGNGDADMSSC